MADHVATPSQDPELELDRLWNDLVAGRRSGLGHALDPSDLETVRAFQTLATTSPHPSAQVNVDRNVAAAIDRAASRQIASASPQQEDPMLAQPLVPNTKGIFPFVPNALDNILPSPARMQPEENLVAVHESPLPSRWESHRDEGTRSSKSRARGWTVGRQVAAALLLFAIIAAALLGGLYPHWPRNDHRLPVFAPAASPGPEPTGVDAQSLLHVTIPSLAASQVWVQIDRYTFSPATTLDADLRNGSSPGVFFVVSGSLEARAFDAPTSARIVRSAGASETALPEGESAALAAGDAVIIPENARVDLMNLSGEPAIALSLFVPSNLMPPGGTGIGYEPLVGNVQTLTSPVTLALTQVTLDPEASFPGSDDPNVETVIALVDPDRVMDARISSNGALRNAGDEPLAAYILTVTSSEEP